MYITPKIKKVKALEKYLIYILFEDGKEKVYDMSNLIDNNNFYSKLKVQEYFLLVEPQGVTVVWPNGEDVCPENLYYDSIDYSTYLNQK